MKLAILFSLVWMSNTIRQLVQQDVWFKLAELFLICLHLYFAKENLEPKQFYLQPLPLIGIDLLTYFQHMEPYKLSLYILPLLIYRDASSLQEHYYSAGLDILHMALAMLYSGLIDLDDGFTIVLLVLATCMLLVRRYQTAQVIKNDIHHEETFNIRTNSDTDRCLDSFQNIISIIKLNAKYQATFSNQKAKSILDNISIMSLLQMDVLIVDKKTRSILHDQLSKRGPSCTDFKEIDQKNTLAAVIEEVISHCKLPHECSVVGLHDSSNYLVDLQIVDTEQFIVSVHDMTDYNVLIKKKHTRTTMKQLFSSFSHEFNTSLNYILALAQVAESHDNIPRFISEKYFRPILCSGKIMHSIISDVMDYNSILGKTFNLQASNFDIPDLVNEVMNLFRDQISIKSLQFEFINLLHRDCMTSDRQRVKQVLINLISNAQKFTTKGFIRIEVGQKVYRKNIYITFHISDSGVGMTDSEQSRLTTLLSQGIPSSQNISTNSIGFGLGLFISNKIAEGLSQTRHEKGGGLRFSTKSGEGFDVWFNVQHCAVSPLIRSNSRTPLINLTKHVVLDTKQTQVMGGRPERANIKPMMMMKQFSNLFGKKFSQSVQVNDDEAKVRPRRPLNEVKIAKDLLQAVAVRQNTYEEYPLNQECTDQEYLDRTRYARQVQQKSVRVINTKQLQQYIQDIPKQQTCKCPTILIADDEQINIMALQIMLEQFRLAADSVFNGLECVNLIHSRIKKTHCHICVDKPYELIFMDISMPILDGIKACRKIKEQSAIIIIACTAFVDNETKGNCYANGMDYFLTKPVKKEQLIEVLQFYDFI